ncbi:MAG: SURF1 family protein [Gammaproteobacteria bacterium]|nr:SURF1 family protein [Gammaproteobacteria bacterium]
MTRFTTISFRPSKPGIVLSLVLIVLFVTLGNWQRDRANNKDELIAAYLSAGQSRTLPDPARAKPGLHLTVRGQFDSQRHTLADNRVYQGKGGVHVYTPFKTNGRTMLVNRGWLELGADRSKLPDVETPHGTLEISGRISEVPGVGRRLGVALVMKNDQWPQLVTYPDIERISAALGQKLYPLVLLLDAESAGGFEGRDWQPVYLSPEKHRAYAFQWYALAVAVFAGWILMSLRRGKSLAENEP